MKRHQTCLFFMAAAAVFTACGTEPSPGPSGLGDELGWIEGSIDPDRGVVVYRTSPIVAGLEDAPWREQALTAVTEDRNGSAGTAAAANSIEFTVECNGSPTCADGFIRPGAVVNGCGAGVNSFELDVTVRSFFTAGLSSAYVEFIELNNVGVDGRANTNDAFEGADVTPCNADPTPRNLTVGGAPVNGTRGLYRYGQLIANPTAPGGAPALAADTARWKFKNPGGIIRFRARLVAEPCVGTCTPALHAPQFWQAEGASGAAVSASAEGDGVIYLGGSFSYVGPRTGSAAAIGAVGAPANAGRAILPWPAVEGGDVFAIAPDGNGGAFLGGTFTSVGGVARGGLAHVNADGSLDSGFAPVVTGTVRALAVAGGRVIVGGTVTALNGVSRSNLGAVNAISGATDLAWVADTNGEVRALLVAGSDLYVGGAFTTVTSAPPPAVVGAGRIARLDVDNGDADATFSALVDVEDGVVTSLALGQQIGSDPNERELFVGGTFTTINGANTGGRTGAGVTRQRLAAINTVALDVRSFAVAINADVNGVATLGTTVFAVGGFTTVNGVSRQRGAAFTNSGTLLSWRPNLNNTAFAIAVDGGIVYIGGQFAARLLAVNPSTAAITPWASVGSNNNSLVTVSAVNAVAVTGSVVHVGGRFRSAGGVPRSGAAALDLTTGEATAWAPLSSSQVVNGMATLSNGDVVLGTATNVLRVREDGTVQWSVNVDAAARAIAVDGADRVYVGGSFTSINGVGRVGLAALSPGDGSVLPWQADTNPGGSVRGLALFRGELYAGGDFTSLQGNGAFSQLAALSDASGAAAVRDAWPANGGVQAVSAQRDAVFVGGNFTVIDGVSRTRLAAIDGTNVTGFNVAPGQPVNAIVALGNNLHIGGAMQTVSGASCGRACTVNTRGLSSGSFNGALTGVVNTVTVAGPFMFVGGALVNSTVNGGGFRNSNVVVLAD
jgi:hypothetical protein